MLSLSIAGPRGLPGAQRRGWKPPRTANRRRRRCGGVYPQTMESFSSSGDGKLTVIKETSPTSFAVEQNVTTKPGAKCSTLDSKTGQIYLIMAERGVTNKARAGQDGGRRGGGRGGATVPGSFTILVVGK